MMETRAFPTLHVLSAITDRLVCDIGGLYEVLSYMAGEPVWTHQLPRVGREAAAVLLAAQPALRQAVEDAKQIDTGNWRQWAKTWLDRYGPELTVPRMTPAQHKSIGPVEELTEMAPGKPVIVVGT